MLVKTYASAQCHVVGNPGIEDGERATPGSYFYVLTDSGLRYRHYNQTLLAVAQALSTRAGLRYFVRYHPDNDPASYGVHPPASRKFPLEKACFAIGHMTSQIYISMRQGIPVYRLRSDITNHPVPDAILFSDAQELAAKAVPQTLFDSTAQEFIAFTGAEADEHYAAALAVIFPGVA
jgi:hypothetical protein